MRRREVVGEHGMANHLVDVTQMTTAQMMRQYKRKLANIDGEYEAPATPVRRVRTTARTAAPLDAVCPRLKIHALLQLSKRRFAVCNTQELCRMRTQTMRIFQYFLILIVQACPVLAVLNKPLTGMLRTAWSVSGYHSLALTM